MDRRTNDGARKGRGHALWVLLLGIVVLVVGYFTLFTSTPDEGTRTEQSLEPADVSEPPGSQAQPQN